MVAQIFWASFGAIICFVTGMFMFFGEDKDQ